MRTNFTAEMLATDGGARANEILRSCVHCGFCNATCPTYQLTGDELDGPRGRIYLIRELLESGANEDRATKHLDRCLTCRACETTCPSGVAYGELAEIARDHLGPARKGLQGQMRRLLQWMVPHPQRLRGMVRVGQLFRWFVPNRFAKNLPHTAAKSQSPYPVADHASQVLLLDGCAQQVNTAATNAHLATLLHTHGIGVVTAPGEVCCGSLDLHLGDNEAALSYMRRNVDALHALLDDVEAIVSTASGCGVTCKDYGRLLAHDDEYAERAAEVAQKTLDVSEYLAQKNLNLRRTRRGQKVAWHAPCTLQHGQQLSGIVETLLQTARYELTSVPDGHICCGSAGTYSMLQPELAEKLKQQKLEALCSGSPDVVASANVGCQMHLATACDVPVVHWIELLK